MRFVFRADGNSEIGMGHITRCLALAQELKKFGSVEFISKPLPVKLPFKAHELRAGDYAGDIAFTRNLLRKLAPDVVVVDHHDIGQDYLDSISAFTDLLVTIDDLKREVCSDVVVNVNAFSLRMKYKCGKGKVFLGPEYALINKAKARKSVRKKAENVLVSMGGTDVLNLTPKVIGALKIVNNVHVTVVIGPAFTNTKEILDSIEGDEKFKAARTNDLPNIMLKHDIAVCGGGTTLYELAATGTPAIIICQAENQLINARELDGKTLINLGMGNGVNCEKISTRITELLGDYGLRGKLSKRGRRMVDCRGPKRVRKIILQELRARKIELVPAGKRDAFDVWKWRNEKSVRDNSFNTSVIPLETHRKWFSGMLHDSKRKTLIINYGGKKIGFVRLDVNGKTKINLAIGKDWRGKGLGQRVIRVACSLVEGELVASVKPENAASIKAFERAGFTTTNTGKGRVEMRLRR